MSHWYLFHHSFCADIDSATGVSGLRLYYSTREVESNDKSYWLAVLGLCATVEAATVILCGCFTSFPRFFKWVGGDREGSGRYNGYRSREHDSESQSRLKECDASVELGKIGVIKEVTVTTGDWQKLR